MKHERGDADRRQEPTNVKIAEHLLLGIDGAWTCGMALETLPPAEHALVARQAGVDERKRLLRVGPGPPARSNPAEVVLPLLLGPLPGVIGRLPAPGSRRVQDQARNALRAGGGEHRAQRAGIGE